MGNQHDTCFCANDVENIRKSLEKDISEIQSFEKRISKLQNFEAKYLHQMNIQKGAALKKLAQKSQNQCKAHLQKYIHLKITLSKIMNTTLSLKQNLYDRTQNFSSSSNLQKQGSLIRKGTSLFQIDKLLQKLEQTECQMTNDNSNQKQIFYDRISPVSDSQKQAQLKELLQELTSKIQLQKRLLPSKMYLSKIFGNTLLAKKYYIQNHSSMVDFCKKHYHFTLSPDCFSLYHSDIAVNMQEFVKYDWTELECLYLNGCNIDNQGWKILVNHAHMLLKLKSLEIQDNQISEIDMDDIAKFPKIRDITFCYAEWRNPLSPTSRNNLRRFKNLNPQINVQFQ